MLLRVTESASGLTLAYAAWLGLIFLAMGAALCLFGSARVAVAAGSFTLSFEALARSSTSRSARFPRKTA